jgi:hypothetical protein
LIEFLDAAVNTKEVAGPYEERGGIMLVAYPGSLKTTIVRAAVKPYPAVMVRSDMNVQQWIKIRDDFVTGRYHGLAFTDFEKIYQRHASTSAHIEGIVKGLVAEGYGISPNGDPRCPVIPAYAMVIGAMTNACMELRYDEWQKSGFLRRFIWLTYTVTNQNKISEAISRWEKIDFGAIKIRPASGTIPANDESRKKELENMMRDQAGFNGTGYVLLKKIAAYLDWKYSFGKNGREHVSELLRDISPAFTKDGGRVTL